MDPAPPDPGDPPERLYEQARFWYERSQQQKRAFEKVKAYIGLWRNDKRLKVAGEILLREIERIEREPVTSG